MSQQAIFKSHPQKGADYMVFEVDLAIYKVRLSSVAPKSLWLRS
jgi:hypothetical protein